MNDQRHDSGDMYGNRKDFPSSTTYWGPRLTQGEVRAIRPDDIQRELIKIANLDPVAIALLTGDVDKLDPNLHCKHVPMTKQGYTLLAASPKLVAFMTTCTEPDQLLSVLRDNSKKYRTQDEIDNAVRTAVDVYNTTLLLSVTAVSDQTNVNTTPGTTGASNPSAPVPTPEPRRSSRLRPSEGKTDEDSDNGTDGDSEDDTDGIVQSRSPRPPRRSQPCATRTTNL